MTTNYPPETTPPSNVPPPGGGDPAGDAAWGCVWWWWIVILIIILIIWFGGWGWGPYGGWWFRGGRTQPIQPVPTTRTTLVLPGTPAPAHPERSGLAELLDA